MLARLTRAAFKPLYHLHYRWLYGRRFPGSQWLSAAVKRWERRWDRRDVPVSAARWDTEYSSGGWDFLDDPAERSRYESIVDLLSPIPDLGECLDIGCGEGVLLRFLPDGLHHRCRGIDLSAVAIAAAREHWPDANFETADAETWQPPAGCAAVVLNECIYYFEEPEATVERYRRALAPGGRLLISAVGSLRTRAILKRLDRELGFSERLDVEAPTHTWHLAVLDG